jgi:hypothetical protein
MHCPQCGTKAEPGAVTCAACDTALPLPPARQAGSKVARTMLGVNAADLLPQRPAEAAAGPAPAPAEGAPRPAAPPAVARTIVGMPAAALPVRPSEPELVGGGTVIGVPPAGQGPSPAPPTGASPANRTLLGVARPGIAPLRPGELPEDDDEAPAPPVETASNELGATFGPGELPNLPEAPAARSPAQNKLARRRIVLPPVKPQKPGGSRSGLRRALPVVVAAAALAIFAVLFAVFWRSAPPLSARVRADENGHDAIEIECPSCPEGTKIQIGTASGTIARKTALVPLAAPLALGENRLKVTLDRPSGRDETVAVTVNVGYRLRPDLSALQNDKPTLQIVVEAVSGTEVMVEGKPVAPGAGPAVHAIDVAADCTGSSDEPATLRRRVPFSVKTPDGATETGNVDVAVGIVPLRLDAPGPHIVIDGETFVLAGRTMKGAEVLAAGRPIQLRPDGTFSQRMSVSSVGATKIEIRARAPGMAPRIVPIAVRRVDKLETAAREFMAEKPLRYADFLRGAEADIGKPVVVSGAVIDGRVQNHQTTFLLDVPNSEGCPNKECRTVLVQGSENPAQSGDVLTAYGYIGKPFTGPSGIPTPHIEVAFTLKKAR